MGIIARVSPAKAGCNAEWWTERLAWPVIAAAVIRMALLSVALIRNGSSILIQSDTLSYLEPGRNLLLHGRFAADGVPDLVRTPGYPLFLAFTSLAGLPAAAVANVILSVLSVVLVWKLGRTVFGDERIALGAAWIFAFEPVSVAFSVTLLSEALFLALLLLSLERLAAFLRGRRLKVLAESGISLAAATLVRPVSYYLPIVLALMLFLLYARIPTLRWKAPAVLLLSALPWLAVWQTRNWVETGYGGLSSIREVNLYFYCATDVLARVEHRSAADVRQTLGYTVFANHNGQAYLYRNYLERHAEQSGWSQAQRLSFMNAEAMQVIRGHEEIFLHSSLAALFKLVFEPGAAHFDRMLFPELTTHTAGVILERGIIQGVNALLKTYPWALVEKIAFEVVLLGLYLFAVRGAFRGAMHRDCFWFLLGIAVYFLAVSAAGGAAGADARLRLPLMPIVCLLAAAGIWRPRTKPAIGI